MPPLKASLPTATLTHLQVQGQALVPAAFMFEMALAAARTLLDQPGASLSAAPLLSGVSIPAPLLLAAPGPRAAMVACTVTTADGSLKVQSSGGVHVVASLASSMHAAAQLEAAPAAQRRLAPLLLASSRTAPTAGPMAVSQLAAHGAGSSTAGEHWAHPASLDASLHAGAVLRAGSSTLSIPAGLGALSVPAKLGSGAAWASVVITAASDKGTATSDVQAVASADSGAAGLRLCSLLSRPLRTAGGASGKAAAPRLVYQVQWRAAEPAGVAAEPVAPAGSFGKLAWLASKPGMAGASAVQLQPASSSPASVISSSIAWLQSAAAQASQRRSVGLHAAAAAVEGSADISGGFGRSAGSLAAIGVAGMLRTAAREQALGSGSLYSLLTSRYSTAAPAAHAAPTTGADTYGATAEGGALLQPRLLETAEAEGHAQQLRQAGASPAASGRVLVSGGLGDLGLLVGAWLAAQPGLHTVLLGRTAHKPLPAALLSSSGLVTAAAADVGCREDVAALGSSSSGAPLHSIMHAGGVLADAVLSGQTAASVRAVFAPKVTGGQLLLQLAAAAPLQQAALFSSTAALIGPAGQANYAAGNSMLGALSAVQQHSGHGATSIMWGAWSVGMAGRDEALLARIKSSGTGLITPAAGLQALAGLVVAWQQVALPPAVAASPFDWPRLQQAARGATVPMFEEFTGSSGKADIASGARHAAAGLVAALRAETAVATLSTAQAAAQIRELVTAALGAGVRCCCCFGALLWWSWHLGMCLLLQLVIQSHT